MKKWTVLEEENVSPSKWMQVLRHKVLLANNKIVDDYYFTLLGNVAVIIAITTENKIVMVRQYRHGTGEVLLELPGGMQQHHATMEECALAEIEEEAGIKATIEQLISLGKISGNPAKTNQVTYGFIIKDAVLNTAQKFDIMEDIELVTVSPRQLLNMVATGDIWVADTVAFIMKAQLLYPELFA